MLPPIQCEKIESPLFLWERVSLLTHSSLMVLTLLLNWALLIGSSIHTGLYQLCTNTWTKNTFFYLNYAKHLTTLSSFLIRYINLIILLVLLLFFVNYALFI